MLVIKKKTVQECLRGFIRKDMPEVMLIEQRSHTYAWTEAEMLTALHRRGATGIVCEIGAIVVGFMIFERVGESFELLNLAVLPEMRRRRIGSEMLVRIKKKMNDQQVTSVVAHVTDENLPAQLCLRKNKFLATRIIKDHWKGYQNDAYEMVYRPSASSTKPREPGNRLTGYF